MAVASTPHVHRGTPPARPSKREGHARERTRQRGCGTNEFHNAQFRGIQFTYCTHLFHDVLGRSGAPWACGLAWRRGNRHVADPTCCEGVCERGPLGRPWEAECAPGLLPTRPLIHSFTAHTHSHCHVGLSYITDCLNLHVPPTQYGSRSARFCTLSRSSFPFSFPHVPWVLPFISFPLLFTRVAF